MQNHPAMNGSAGFATSPAPRALVQEMRIRPPVIGKIRLGIQVLTSAGKKNEQVARIYRDGVEAGRTFNAIARQIEADTGQRHCLRPENTEHLSISASDFTNPDAIETLMDLYGEDRGQGKRIYALPIMFPFDDVLEVMPHRFAAYTASTLQYFSEYGNAGERYCMTYAKPVQSQVSNRLTRSFGGRVKETRQDEYIDGHCDFERCPQYQDKKCSLDLSLFFLIPGLKGAGVVQAHSTSTIAMMQWYGTLSLVKSAKGSLRNVQFHLTKKLMDTNYINDKGVMEKSKNWITILTSPIELPKLIQEEERLLLDKPQAVVSANHAANLLENRSDVVEQVDAVVSDEQAYRHGQLLDYLEMLSASDKTPIDKAIAELKGYLAYLKVKPSVFHLYAVNKHGDNWDTSLVTVQKLIGYVSIKTEAELKHVLGV